MITTHVEAKDYIGRALDHAGISRSEPIAALWYPKLLEDYDKVEPLTQAEADLVIEVVTFAVVVKGEGTGET